MHWFNGDWHMGWMGIWWLLILIPLLIAASAWASFRGGRGPNASPESPERILKRRYAGGEIDRETYLRMLSDLKGG